MPQIEYRGINSEKDIINLVKEMKKYAIEHLFDHKKMISEVETDVSLKRERIGPMMRVVGQKDLLHDYNKFVAFRNQSDKGVYAIQISYTIAADLDIMGSRQLTLVENLKQTLPESLVELILSYFFEGNTEVIKVNGTPPHVCVFFTNPFELTITKKESHGNLQSL